MKKILLIIILCVAIVTPAFSQNGVPADSLLKTIEALYNSARYLDAELEARRLREESTLTDSFKVRIDTWIAFSLIAQGKTTAARDRFVTLLTMEPDFELDPVLTSPKILTVFNDAKAKYLTLQRSLPNAVQSSPVENRSGISYRTFVFPGWEQLHQGRKISGAVFLGAGALTLGAGVTFEFLRSGARDEYRTATVLSDISSKYDTYNTYRKAEIYSFIAFAVIYLASEIDVVTEYNASAIVVNSRHSTLGGNSLTVSVRF